MPLNDSLDGVPANRSKYRSSWEEKYQSKFNSLLERLDEDELKAIKSLTGQKVKSLGKRDSVNLYTLHRFIRDKKETVKEFAEKKDDLITEEEAYLYILGRLDGGYEKIVYHTFLFHNYEKESTERIYDIDNKLPNNYLEQFDRELRGLKISLDKNTNSTKFRCPEENRINFLESNLLVIDRKTSDKEERDVSGIQWRRNVGSVFLEVKQDEIRIRTKSKQIRKALISKLQDIWQISVTPSDIIEKKLDADKFSNAIKTADNDEDLKILNIDFRNTRDNPTVPLTLSKKSWGVDISKLARKIDGKIVDVELLNIRKFWAEIENADVKIKVNKKDQGRLRLESDIKKIKSRDRKREIKEKFSQKFGVPLDKDILEHEVTDDRDKIISFLLRNPATKDIRRGHEDLIEDLEELGVINVKQIQRKQCTSCRNIIKRESIEKCGKCSGELEKFGSPLKDVSASKPGMRKFFKKILEQQGLEYNRMRSEQIYKKKYKFLPIEYKGEVIDVLLPEYGLGLTDKSLTYLMKSLRPVLAVYKGGSINEKWIEKELSEKADLSEIIDLYLRDELPEDYLITRLQNIVEDKERRVAKNSKTAKEELTKIRKNPAIYTGSDPGGEFERELFHIFKQIIPNSEQWGEKRSGDQPDGFCEILYKKSGRKYYRSFAYDSKFSKKEELKLDTGETKTIRSYVKKINKSEQVLQSQTKFRNFIVVTNCDKTDDFSNLAGRLNRMRSWNGVPVLMNVDFLLGLHSVYNENIQIIKDHRNLFMEELFKTINGGQERYEDTEEDFYIELGKTESVEFAEKLDDKIEDDSLEITNLREWMEKDIYP